MLFAHDFYRTLVEFWGWQRSDGGKYEISIDDGRPVIVDYHNATSTGDDPPLRLFSKTGLTNKAHTLIIKNIEDSRFGRPGQMNGTRVDAPGSHFNHVL